MALGHEDGLLLGRLVAKPTVLLLGAGSRRRRRMRCLAFVEHGNSSAVVHIRAFCGTLHPRLPHRDVLMANTTKGYFLLRRLPPRPLSG